MNKKFFISALAATFALVGVAQQVTTGKKELNKEITLEKDFVPVVKNAAKKNTLPAVQKVTAPAKTTLSHSETPVDIEVPTTIPTMMPYGYRTAHNFSDKRGYLGFGAGTQANVAIEAGYRVIDKDSTTFSLWFNHNSTWAGKNSSPAFDSFEYLHPIKQKFNDNRLGFDFKNDFDAGTLTLNALGHFDSFNYYAVPDADPWDGGDPYLMLDWGGFDNGKKQSFVELQLGGDWDGSATIADKEFAYRASMNINHAGYSILPTAGDTKGAKDTHLNFGIGADYETEGGSTFTLDVTGDYVNFKSAKIDGYKVCKDNSYFLLTLSPRYSWENDVFSAEVGADVLLGKPQIYLAGGELDNASVHVAPVVNLDMSITEGASVFVEVGGETDINTLSVMREESRYSDPTGRVTNSWCPVIGEFGFKVGPFAGFSAKLYGGYAMIKGDLTHLVLMTDEALNSQFLGIPNAACNFLGYKSRGFMAGADLNYKYRSLLEASANFAYNIRKDGDSDWGTCYALAMDDPHWTAKFDLKVTPMRQLALNAGFELRKDRVALAYCTQTDEYGDLDLGDVKNLYAGASWRFDKVVTLWVKASNLLNKRWDDLYGMGAQRLNVMAGVGLVF